MGITLRDEVGKGPIVATVVGCITCVSVVLGCKGVGVIVAEILAVGVPERDVSFVVLVANVQGTPPLSYFVSPIRI